MAAQFRRNSRYCFGVFGCSGLFVEAPLCELEFDPAAFEPALFGVADASGVLELDELELDALGLEAAPAPATFTLSTMLRLPANDCAMRRASSRSFSEGALPLSVIVLSVTSTETLLLVSVGSL